VKKIVVHDIQKTIRDERVRLSAEVDIQGWTIPDRQNPPARLFVEFPESFQDVVAPSGDAFIAAFLLQCMAGGSDLHIRGPVSGKLLANMDILQNIWSAWSPEEFQRIEVRADQITPPARPPDKTAAFFSLGVDSFYTLMKNKKLEAMSAPRIDYLIYMRGFEHRLEEDITNRQLTQDLITRVSEQTDCKPIFGTTNFRAFFGLRWLIGHGMAVGFVALALSQGLSRILISGHTSYAKLLNREGTHALTDPLWSTESLRVIHDGAETTRQGKVIALIKHMPEAFANLRVCWKNVDEKLNCGKCLKCTDVMLTLDMLGRLDQAPTFPDRLNEDYARVLRCFPRVAMYWFDEYLRIAREYDDRRYRTIERIFRARRKDEWRREMHPRWDRLTQPWRDLLCRIRY